MSNLKNSYDVLDYEGEKITQKGKCGVVDTETSTPMTDEPVVGEDPIMDYETEDEIPYSADKKTFSRHEDISSPRQGTLQFYKALP